MKGFEDLLVWQKAVDVCVDFYNFTAKLPIEEKFGLKSQINRAVVSISSNIAEGYDRSSKDFARFLDISLGSAAELHTQIEIVRRIYGHKEDCDKLKEKICELRRMIQGLQKAVMRKSAGVVSPRLSPLAPDLRSGDELGN